MHTEEQHSRSFGVTATYSNSSNLESHSSLYFNTNFISVQTIGCRSVGSKDSWTVLCYGINSETVGGNETVGATIGYLCCTRYFSCV